MKLYRQVDYVKCAYCNDPAVAHYQQAMVVNGERVRVKFSVCGPHEGDPNRSDFLKALLRPPTLPGFWEILTGNEDHGDEIRNAADALCYACGFCPQHEQGRFTDKLYEAVAYAVSGADYGTPLEMLAEALENAAYEIKAGELELRTRTCGCTDGEPLPATWDDLMESANKEENQNTE